MKSRSTICYDIVKESTTQESKLELSKRRLRDNSLHNGGKSTAEEYEDERVLVNSTYFRDTLLNHVSY